MHTIESEKHKVIKNFLDSQSYELVGWQNEEIYQNFNITIITGITKNRKISNKKELIKKRYKSIKKKISIRYFNKMFFFKKNRQ